MPDTLTPDTMLHGRYRIEQLLRSGAKGAVYLATDAQAAAKTVIIHESTDPSPEAEARFEQEARVLTSLEHPGLPVVIDYFIEPDGRRYLVVEHVLGITLEEALRREGPLPEAQVIAWCDRLLSAVEYLHARRPPVIHGRVSPANILITPDGTPRLIGLIDAGEEAPGEGPGARSDDPFTAPEQASGTYDERSDIYSIGATLYAALTGRKPPSPAERAAGVELPPLRRFRRSISAAVEAAVLRAMSLDPDQRFPGVSALWHALQAPPPKNPIRVPRALRVGVVVAALVLALGVVCRLTISRLGTPGSLLQLANQAQEAVPPTPTARLTLVAPTRLAPTATPLPTARPTATATQVEPTATPLPTDTPLPTATPVPTRRQTARPRPSPSPTQAPAVRRVQPPALLAPGNGATVAGSVEFRWYWPETLAEDECFDLQVWRLGTQPAGIAWCRSTSCRISAPPAGPGDYLWRVQVIRVADGQVKEQLSEPSAQRTLKWLQ